MAAYKCKSPQRPNKKKKARYELNQSFTFAPRKIYAKDPNPEKDPWESSQATDRIMSEE